VRKIHIIFFRNGYLKANACCLEAHGGWCTSETANPAFFGCKYKKYLVIVTTGSKSHHEIALKNTQSLAGVSVF